MLKSFSVLLIAIASVSAAHADGYPDDSKTFPTLAQLCLSEAKMQGSALSLGTAVISPYEVVDLRLQCQIWNRTSQTPAITFSINPTRSLVHGTQSYSSVEAIRDVTLTTDQVKGHTEVVIAYNGLSTSGVLRYILNLNANGQPVNTLNHFDGTVDPTTLVSGSEDASQYASGYYIRQSADDSLKTCVLLADTSDDVAQCVAQSKDPNQAQRKSAVTIGDRMYETLTIPFGWKADRYPTNTDLDMAASRVDFQKSLSELQALIQRDYTNSDPAATAALVKEGENAIGQALNN